MAQARIGRKLRDSMRPKKRNLLRLGERNRGEEVEFLFGFKDNPDDRSVGVFFSDSDKEPILVIPIRGELNEERKLTIVKKLMEVLHVCFGLNPLEPLNIDHIGPDKKEDAS